MKCEYFCEGKCSILRNQKCQPSHPRCTWSINQYQKVKEENAPNRYFDKYSGTYRTIEVGFDYSDSKPRIFVFRGFLRTDNVVDCVLKVRTMDDKFIPLVVGYNEKTGRFYLPETIKDYFIRTQTLLNVYYIISNAGSRSFKTSDFDGFDEFSKLKLYGYSVAQDGPSEEFRHQIIEYLIDNNIMRKITIYKHLQGLISLREYSDKDYSNAIAKWESDMIFVLHLNRGGPPYLIS